MGFEKLSDQVILVGCVTSIRKFDTGRGYAALSFDLDLGSLQFWHAIAFGRTMADIQRIGECGWGRFTAYVSEIRGPRGPMPGLRIESASVSSAPQPRHEEVILVEAVSRPQGRRSWLEFTDLEGISYCADSLDDNLISSLASLASGGLRMKVSWRSQSVLQRDCRERKERYLPVMASELLSADLSTIVRNNSAPHPATRLTTAKNPDQTEHALSAA